MTIVIHPVLPADVHGCWPVARERLCRAFDQSEIDTADAHLPLLLADQEQLWRIADLAWAITRVVAGKRGRLFEFVALAGRDMGIWKRDFFSTAEAWAKQHGCVGATFTGRMGWAKALPDYRAVRVTRIKELQHA